MKKLLFGIALILFAIFLFLTDMQGVLGADWFILIVSLTGLAFAGVGAFAKDE